MPENSGQSKSEYVSPDFDKLVPQMAEEGFAFQGMEHLTQTKFSAEAKFEPTPLQTTKEIINKYSNNGEYEVKLVLKLSPQMEKLLREDPSVNPEQVRDSHKSYLVFTKKG